MINTASIVVRGRQVFFFRVCVVNSSIHWSSCPTITIILSFKSAMTRKTYRRIHTDTHTHTTRLCNREQFVCTFTHLVHTVCSRRSQKEMHELIKSGCLLSQSSSAIDVLQIKSTPEKRRRGVGFYFFFFHFIFLEELTQSRTRRTRERMERHFSSH